MRRRPQRRIDAGLVAYTEFGGALTQVPTVTQVVPILPPEAGGAPPPGGARAEALQYTYEPSAASILSGCSPVEVQVFGYPLESAASWSARMVAMRNATKSAQDHAEPHAAFPGAADGDHARYLTH